LEYYNWEGAANGQHDGWFIQAASVGEAEEGTGLDAAGSDFADLAGDRGTSFLFKRNGTDIKINFE
jgi:hypothetical protein